LNAHEIRLFGDPNIYLIQMGAEGKSPHCTTFIPYTGTLPGAAPINGDKQVCSGLVSPE
jgi:hypothetical protein